MDKPYEKWFKVLPVLRDWCDDNLITCTDPLCQHDCDDGPLFFRSACHPEVQGVNLGYKEGILYAACRVCDRLVAPPFLLATPTLKIN